MVKHTAPAAIGKVITKPESEQYATLVDKVSERIWTRYLDPNIEDSPLPLMVQTLVVTELGASAPPTGTVPTPGPRLGLTDRAAPPQDLPPTENLNNQQEETRSRTVYLPVAGGAPDPHDEGGPSADEDPHRNGRGRRDKHGRSARGGANGRATRAESDDSEDDESDHGRPRRKKGDKKHKGPDNSSDSSQTARWIEEGAARNSRSKRRRRNAVVAGMKAILMIARIRVRAAVVRIRIRTTTGTEDPENVVTVTGNDISDSRPSFGPQMTSSREP